MRETIKKFDFKSRSTTSFVSHAIDDMYRDTFQEKVDAKIVKNITLFGSTRIDILPRHSCRISTKGISDISGSSSSLEEEHVLERAVGEFVERYVSSSSKNATVTVYSKNDRTFLFPWQKKEVLEFCDMGNFFSWQNKTHDAIGKYLLTKDLVSKKKFLISMDLVFWGERERASTIYPTTTNGCGAGENEVKASVSAMAELLERDQFLLCWLTKKGFKNIDIASIPEDYTSKRIVDSLCERGLKPYIFDIRIDTKIPTFLAVILDDRIEPVYIGTGGSCKANPDAAISSSLYEAVSVLETVINTNKQALLFDTNLDPFTQYEMGRLERLHYWRDQNIKDITWLLQSEKVTYKHEEYDLYCHLTTLEIFEVLKSDLYQISLNSELPKAGVFLYTFTSDCAKKAKIKVVRCCVPGVLMLYLREDTAFVNNVRLSKMLGKKSSYTITQADLNKFPHPFP